MSHVYVATSHKSSSVTASVVASFTGASTRNLILARGNYVEIHTLTESGLVPERSIPLFGRITAMECYRPTNAETDLIFVLTEKKHFVVLGWDILENKPLVKTTGNLKDRFGKELELGHKLFIDVNNRLIGAYVQEGIVKCIPIDNSGLKEVYDIRLDVLRPIDVQFFNTFAKPAIGVLYEDHRRGKHLKFFSIDPRERGLGSTSDCIWTQNHLDAGAKMVIPIASPIRGAIVIGESTITYYTLSSTETQSVVINGMCGEIVAYCKIDQEEARFLLGDDRGRLYVLVLGYDREKLAATFLAIDFIGQTNICQTLNYLDNGIVFVGCCYGDSQLIRLNKDKNADGSYVDILDRYDNIGPILDMVVIAGERQGQSHLVTCSGGFGNGSLRIVRSGIGIHEQASMELEGLKAIWSLQGHGEQFDKYLVQSYIGESRILAIENAEMGEVEDVRGFVIEQETLFCCKMVGNLFLQVTSTSARLLDDSDFSLVHEYVADNIVLASGNSHQVVLALNGGEILFFTIDESTRQLVKGSSTRMEHDVACLSLRPLESNTQQMEVDDGSSVESPASILVVGLWTDNSVRLLALPTLQELTRVSIGGDTQVRDALLVSLGETPYLLVGMGDGALHSFQVDISSNEGLPVLTNRRKVILGSRPISFTVFKSEGYTCVFASCDRPTVIYSNNKKLLFSVVNIPETNSMAPFNCEMFPDSLCLSSERGLTIGSIDAIQKLHTQSIPVEGSPRRITYHSTAGVYAVCMERYQSPNSTNTSASGKASDFTDTQHYVVFYDEVDMRVIYEHRLDVLEQSMSCISCVVQLSSNGTSSKELIFVGTTYNPGDDTEATRGRVLVFDANLDIHDHNKKTHLISEMEIPGTAFSMTPIKGNIAVAINNKVQVFRCVESSTSLSASSLEGSSSSSGSGSSGIRDLQLVADALYQGCVLALYLKSHGDYILVGDILRSVSLLKYSSEDAKLFECSRDFSANYMRAVEILGNNDDFFLGIDDSGNMFTLKRKGESASDEERAKLDVFGEFHLGDYVNVIRRGSLANQGFEFDTSAMTGKSSSSNNNNNNNGGSGSELIHPVLGTPIGSNSYIFGTISGALGTMLILSESCYKYFSSLEKSIRSVIGSLGGLSHSEWRAFANERRSTPHKNVVDGDLIQQFLDLPKETQEVIVRQFNIEISTVATPLAAVTASSSMSSSASLASVLSSDIKNISLQEVIEKVEDIGRLH